MGRAIPEKETLMGAERNGVSKMLFPLMDGVEGRSSLLSSGSMSESESSQIGKASGSRVEARCTCTGRRGNGTTTLALRAWLSLFFLVAGTWMAGDRVARVGVVVRTSTASRLVARWRRLASLPLGCAVRAGGEGERMRARSEESESEERKGSNKLWDEDFDFTILMGVVGASACEGTEGRGGESWWFGRRALLWGRVVDREALLFVCFSWSLPAALACCRPRVGRSGVGAGVSVCTGARCLSGAGVVVFPIFFSSAVAGAGAATTPLGPLAGLLGEREVRC